MKRWLARLIWKAGYVLCRMAENMSGIYTTSPEVRERIWKEWKEEANGISTRNDSDAR